MPETTTEFGHAQADQLTDFIIALGKRHGCPLYVCILDDDGEILRLTRFDRAPKAARLMAAEMAHIYRAHFPDQPFWVGVGSTDITSTHLHELAAARPRAWITKR